MLLALVAISSRVPLINSDVLLHGDEAVVGIMAQDIAELRRFPIYYYNQRYMGALEAYVVALLNVVGLTPLTALRTGPALFFAGLTVVQYLMLARLFGRYAAGLGSSLLIASSPMFAFWSITARGGYVEIFLLGTLLIWTYLEWFAESHFSSTTSRQRFLLGLIVGLGIWINPMIIGFIAAIGTHALLRPRRDKRTDDEGVDRTVRRNHPFAGYFALLQAVPFSLLALGLLAIFLTTLIFNGEVVAGQVVISGLATIVPQSVVVLVASICIAIAAGSFRRRFRREVSGRFVALVLPVIYGAATGASPAILYAFRQHLINTPAEPSLPLVIRPFSSLAEPFTNLWHGLPILFGAHSDSFLSLYLFGREATLHAFSPLCETILIVAGWLGAGAFAGAVIIAALQAGPELCRALRCIPHNYSPTVLFAFATGWFVLLYLFCAAVYDFHSIRYLLLLWVPLPGLIAAAVASRWRRLATLCCLTIIASYGVCQIGLWARLPDRHPLHDLADQLQAVGVTHAYADGHDGPMVTFWAQQDTKLADWGDGWPRLIHLRPEIAAHREQTNEERFVIRSKDRDWQSLWPYPGGIPPELRRGLRDDLQRRIERDPACLKHRQTLNDHYEVWTFYSLSNDAK